MDWSNERFVRFFTRDTVTWKKWSWEAKAVWGLLLRKVDRAGVVDTGREDKTDALALILEIPCEVAARVVPEWLKSGALVESEGGYLAPRFLEAQEAPISDKQRQAESRANRRSASMRSSEVACHTVSRPVTPSHTASQPVTPDQLDQTSQTRPEKHVRALSVVQPEVDALKAAWNELTSPPIARWQSGRAVVALAALKRRPLEQWREVFQRIEASSFCRGSDGGWVADIDWALRGEGKKPETALKVLEGAFDRGARPPVNSRAPVAVPDWLAVVARALAECGVEKRRGGWRVGR